MSVIHIQKLSIHFGYDKTRSILFSNAECLKEINISFAAHSIKQQDTVKYLGCQLVSMTSKFLWKKTSS